MFSSKSFIVSALKFRSLIHFEFIFVYGVRKCSSFILLQVVDQFSQHHLLKRLSFNPLYILASFVKDKVSICAWIYLCSHCFLKRADALIPGLHHYSLGRCVSPVEKQLFIRLAYLDENISPWHPTLISDPRFTKLSSDLPFGTVDWADD